MAATNRDDDPNDVSMSVAETSMTGQELLQQIATMVGHDHLAKIESIATSPIDTSPIKNPPVTVNKRNSIAQSIEAETTTAVNTNNSPPPAPPVVYGELSILGYNGYIPNSERNGRKNKNKFLLCKRSAPNGIKKSEHYIVKQPQATKAIQDKDNYSISYTFSSTQTIIVEYKQDAKTDLFQIGRSSEDPIDFVVMDTVPSGGTSVDSSNSNNNKRSSVASLANHNYTSNGSQNYSENASGSQHVQQPFDLVEMTRFHRHLAKVEEEMLHGGIPPYPFDPRCRLPPSMYGHISGQPQPVPMNYPPPNLSNLPPLMAEHFRRQELSLFNMPHNQQIPTGFHNQHHHHQQQLHYLPHRSSHMSTGGGPSSHDNRHSSSNHNYQYNNISGNTSSSKRTHTAQSTISRFACRVIVEREPPYTARIYAAGFDSSKNIFLGEKATKWEQNNSIDGLTTNGILLMHPKRGYFCDTSMKHDDGSQNNEKERLSQNDEKKMNDNDDSGANNVSCRSDINNRTRFSDTRQLESLRDESRTTQSGANDSNNNNNAKNLISADENFEYGGVWREVSVDGGIYAIRESRSAIQKGKRIENETNILQDGTLIDLCGATLLWRSTDGFKSSPTKRTLEEKIDLLNASRPQCPVGLNTLVIPRKPILPGSGDRHQRRSSSNHHGYKEHHHHHHSGSKDHHRQSHYSGSKGSEKGGSSQQPYVYLKCGHVQGYHDWGATDKSDQRTCPICLSVGTVAKLSMGLEPSFYVDSGPLTHVFNPCGHMSSERTIRYWTSIKIPHGTHFFHSICPFCATPLATDEPTSTRLIFQEDLD